jgi:hypothetical protein
VRAQVSAGSRRSRRARLETEVAAPIPPSQAARRHSLPRRLAVSRSAPASRAATQSQYRLYRPQNGSWWELDAHSLRAPRGCRGGGHRGPDYRHRSAVDRVPGQALQQLLQARTFPRQGLVQQEVNGRCLFDVEEGVGRDHFFPCCCLLRQHPRADRRVLTGPSVESDDCAPPRPDAGR